MEARSECWTHVHGMCNLLWSFFNHLGTHLESFSIKNATIHMPRICTYNWHSRKIDGSPSVLHRFGRYWMILKAKTLVYTRKVMYGSLVESLCKKKIPGNDFCIPHHHQKYQNEKSFPGIYFFTGFQPSSCTLPCACRPTSEPSESSSIALKDAKLMENHQFS